MHYSNDVEVIQRLRQANLKVTPQRVAILSELIKNYDHPTADNVYKIIKKRIPNISFDTVNRTLIAFSQSGVIKVAEAQGGAKRYDPMKEPHHHFHCVKCNRIIDFENKGYDSIEPPEEITKKHQVIDQKVLLEGVCQNCKVAK
jgi:Fur family transcriptional regulator, peroxide stress response regulator